MKLKNNMGSTPIFSIFSFGNWKIDIQVVTFKIELTQKIPTFFLFHKKNNFFDFIKTFSVLDLYINVA